MNSSQLKILLYVYGAFMVIALSSVAQVWAASSTVSPPYANQSTGQTNCVFPWIGQSQFFTCSSANTSTGSANEIAWAYPGPCDLCNGAVYPSTYVFFDTQNPNDGAALYGSNGMSLYMKMVTRFNGPLSANYESGVTFSEAWFKMQLKFTHPDGSVVWYIWQMWDTYVNGNANVISCDNGQPNVWCVYILSVNIASSGTYHLGGGYQVSTQASYQQVYGSSAIADFWHSGDYATVGSFVLSTT